MPKKIDPQLRARCVRLVREHAHEYPTLTAATGAVARQEGVSQEAVRRWLAQAEIDEGTRPGITSEEHAEIRRLKKENAELRRANEILRRASVFFAGGAVRHEVLGVSRGGERPSPLGRRSGLSEAGGSLSRETSVRVASGPDKGESCRDCQTVRACRARSEGAA